MNFSFSYLHYVSISLCTMVDWHELENCFDEKERERKFIKYRNNNNCMCVYENSQKKDNDCCLLFSFFFTFFFRTLLDEIFEWDMSWAEHNILTICRTVPKHLMLIECLCRARSVSIYVWMLCICACDCDLFLILFHFFILCCLNNTDSQTISTVQQIFMFLLFESKGEEIE